MLFLLLLKQLVSDQTDTMKMYKSHTVHTKSLYSLYVQSVPEEQNLNEWKKFAENQTTERGVRL